MPRAATAAEQPLQRSLFDDWEVPAVHQAAPGVSAVPAAPPATATPHLRPGPAPAPASAPAPGPAALTALPLPPPATAAENHARGGHAVWLQDQRVPYELRRSRRRTIGFSVGPEGLSVNAPRWVGQGEIEQALRSKAAWILRKLVEQRERHARTQAARVHWADGASLPFLGETVIIVLDPRVTGAQLRSAENALPGVPRLTLHLGLPQAAAMEQIRDSVQSWLQRQARRVFEERCAFYAAQLGVTVRRLSLSSAATRWGSATADGSIRLNWRLVHFGIAVIDYVVAHELAHLREMNHSPAFWGVVRSLVPDYEQARERLRDEVLPVLD